MPLMSTRGKNKDTHRGNRADTKDVSVARRVKHVVVPATPDAIRISLGITKENGERVERLDQLLYGKEEALPVGLNAQLGRLHAAFGQAAE